MESPTETVEGDGVINANRNVVGEGDTPSSPAPSTTAIPVAAAAATRDAIDWRKLWPWILGVILFLFIVWLITRRGGNSGGATA